ncbi:7-carboxy-7-deazaguanine synthase QueE [Lutibacter sp.]|uniref:7-carboxy-7-deazaguanine synthase QueE n=1 Tax=Lutibacter sp. TaxID=1925666 RepID=UPI0025B7E064|nr:7-carboxy-7-deazaguanine synthase QueE [Lutibacter sp.]MCF6167407.1 7-carboxy-7-deazaguanine synthase QueE [Lutibacter sp.]
MIDKYTQQLIDRGEMLPLMEEFYTIQGEGFHSGKAAYFIRIGGCDVGCHWCDVKESWDANLHPPTKTNLIINNATNQANTVVVTGGEPLMWNLDYLTKKLQNNNIKTHIETSGSYKLSGTWDWICLSPKKMKLPLKEIYKKTNELKIIVVNKQDFKFAEEQASKVSKNCKLFLQPEWSKRKQITPLIIDYVMKNPQWKISLQIHKYLNIP